MSGRRRAAIPAFTIVASAIIVIATLAIALRLARPIHLDNLDRRASAAAIFADIDTRLDINRANAAELSLLPGVGPRLARRIVDHRAAHGPFRSLDDLQRVSGIGAKIIERLDAYAMAGPHDATDGASVARAPDEPGGVEPGR